MGIPMGKILYSVIAAMLQQGTNSLTLGCAGGVVKEK
jgi:hypothetical protein